MNDRQHLQELFAIGRQWETTSLSDLITLALQFRSQLEHVEKHLAKPRPKVVCLCGSTRFMLAFYNANLNETLLGNIVLSVGCSSHSDADLKLTEETKGGLGELHKRKIDISDEIFVLNVGGYIGPSTRSEIEYAERHDVPVRYLEPIS